MRDVRGNKPFSAMRDNQDESAATIPFPSLLCVERNRRRIGCPSLGVGAASASCYQVSAGGDSCLGADSFSATFLEVGLSYGFPVAARTLVGLKLLGGFTDLSPGPVQRNGTVPDHMLGPHAGAGLSLDYDTQLDHFAVGLDALVRETFAASYLKITSLAVMPRIRYVF